MLSLRKNLLFLSASLTLISSSFADVPAIGGRLNRSRSEAPAENKKNPSGVSKTVWRPEGYASADSVTSSIGYSMLKWSFGLGIAFGIIALAFSAGVGSQHSHSHTHSH